MIYPILLSGGYGNRLRPLSHPSYPKQFLKIDKKYSLLQHTILRNLPSSIVTINAQHHQIINEQLIDSKKPHMLILEKEQIGTALSIAIAASTLSPDSIIVVSPADLYIENTALYNKVIKRAINYITCHRHNIVFLATTAKNYNPGYGYMKLVKRSDYYYTVQQFIEKPSRNINYHQYYWNTGIFICTVEQYLSQLQKHANYLFKKISLLSHYSYYDQQYNLCMTNPITNVNQLSVDKAMMEKITNAVAIVEDFGWQDLGSWSVLYNHIFNNNDPREIFVIENKFDQLVISEVITGKLFIATFNHHAFFITNIALKTAKYYIKRRWGKYKVLYDSDNIKIKHLMITPRKSTSLQIHQYRKEYCFVVTGNAHFVIGDQQLYSDQWHRNFFINQHQKHQITNNDDQSILHIIEVQSGNPLLEEDIVRFL